MCYKVAAKPKIYATTAKFWLKSQNIPLISEKTQVNPKRKMASEYDDLKALRRGLRYQLSEVLLTQVKARLPMKSGSDRRVKLLLVTAYSKTPVI